MSAASLGRPEPCIELDVSSGIERGHAILKDRNGLTQYLLITTGIVAGVEDPKLLEPEAPNYWLPAWSARRHVEARAGVSLPRDSISLALNSAYGRTQNQFHIHIDCVRADVLAALKANSSAIGPDWGPFPVPFNDHVYQAMRLVGETLGIDPTLEVARRDEAVRSAMGRQTIVVVGATFEDGAPGFYLLTDTADLARFDRASGEELQDHACALADRKG